MNLLGLSRASRRGRGAELTPSTCLLPPRRELAIRTLCPVRPIGRASSAPNINSACTNLIPVPGLIYRRGKTQPDGDQNLVRLRRRGMTPCVGPSGPKVPMAFKI